MREIAYEYGSGASILSDAYRTIIDIIVNIVKKIKST